MERVQQEPQSTNDEILIYAAILANLRIASGSMVVGIYDSMSSELAIVHIRMAVGFLGPAWHACFQRAEDPLGGLPCSCI